VTEQPITYDERVLLEHCWAVRVNFPTDIAQVAQLTRRAVGVARCGSLAVPSEVEAAVEVLERWAVQIAGYLSSEQTERASSGLDAALFERQLERAALGAYAIPRDEARRPAAAPRATILDGPAGRWRSQEATPTPPG
jgi:hypothetical protein